MSTVHHDALFFHSPDFIFRHSPNNIITFTHQDVSIYFNHEKNQLVSLNKSPFGGFVTSAHPSEKTIDALIKKICAWSITQSIQSIVIRNFPVVYNEVVSKETMAVLSQNLFTVLHNDITQVLVTADENIPLNVHRKRRLKRCLSQGYTFEKLDVSFLSEAYQLIVESRVDKGYPVTMTFAELQKMFDEFPKQYFLFGVKDGLKVIAACVAIRVSSRILYCFYIGDALSYRQVSPVTMLVEGIYKFAKLHHYTLIDLGISTDKGMLNDGLYSFKKSLGCIDSPKLTFIKQF